MLEQHILGILLGDVHKRALFAALGHMQRNRRAAPLAQQHFQRFHILRFGLQQHLAGNHAVLPVVLGQEAREYLARGIAALLLQQKMLPVLHAAVMDMYQLHHRVYLVGCHGNNVLLHRAGLDGQLMLGNGLHIGDLIAVHGSLLVLHGGGRLVHLFAKLGQHGLRISV